MTLSQSIAFGGIGTAIIIAVFGIFAILVLEFGNFKSTLIVLTVVPLGVLGGLALQNVGLYSPMAWVIIGGLISSTLPARLVTPLMCKLIPPAA